MKRIDESSPFLSPLINSATAECSANAVSANTIEKNSKVVEISGNYNVSKPGWLKAFINLFIEKREQRQTRKILNSLSSTQLKDIGLSCRDIDKLYGSGDESRKIWPNWPK